MQTVHIPKKPLLMSAKYFDVRIKYFLKSVKVRLNCLKAKLKNILLLLFEAIYRGISDTLRQNCLLVLDIQ